MTKEQILNEYLTSEHDSPVIQFMRMTSHRDIDMTAPSPTSERIQKYLEQEQTTNEILKQYM